MPIAAMRASAISPPPPSAPAAAAAATSGGHDLGGGLGDLQRARARAGRHDQDHGLRAGAGGIGADDLVHGERDVVGQRERGAGELL